MVFTACPVCSQGVDFGPEYSESFASEHGLHNTSCKASANTRGLEHLMWFEIYVLSCDDGRRGACSIFGPPCCLVYCGHTARCRGWSINQIPLYLIFKSFVSLGASLTLLHIDSLIFYNVIYKGSLKHAQKCILPKKWISKLAVPK